MGQPEGFRLRDEKWALGFREYFFEPIVVYATVGDGPTFPKPNWEEYRDDERNRYQASDPCDLRRRADVLARRS